MNAQEIFFKVREIVADTADVEINEIGLENNLMNDIGLSSMDILSMIADIESCFKIRISEKLLRTFVTVQDIANCVLEKKQGEH